jgi:hypothetical protein
MKATILVIFFLISLNSFSQQPTIGLRLSSGEASEGYTLFTPEKNNSVYLIDNCGEVVNTWEFTELPALTCYLLENGNLLRAGKDSLEIRDWDNQLIWSYSTTLNGFPQHHDIEPLPNGNILVLSKETFDATGLIAIGRDPNLGAITFVTDVIYELQPINSNEAQLVWQWKFSEHFVQEFDNTKSNYDVVADHPELLDINFNNAEVSDYTHANAIDYDPQLDQILITARHLSELLIIDHSTTLSEASGHTGGNSGMGGDFIYRWGNPQVYQGGSPSDQKLHLPHDGKWVNQGFPNAGKLTVFNNQGDGVSTNSSVHVIAPEIVANVYQMNSNKYLPEDYQWSWTGSVLGQTFSESKKCGMMELENGNHLVCTTSNGSIFEIDQNDQVIWVYRNPSGPNNTIYQQNEVVPNNTNTIFRGERYPTNFIGFVGKDLSPQGTIEDNNTETTNCANTADLENLNQLRVSFENPVSNQFIKFSNSLYCSEISLFNLSGQLVQTTTNFEGKSLKVNCEPGVYVLYINNGQEVFSTKVIVE